MTPGVTVHTADAVATGRVVAEERPPAGSCRLSIIVPVYNVEPFVEKCLRSLLDQGLDHADYEIIVVDDGSDDRSMEIVRSLTRDGPIRIHSQPNAGLSAARNAGIRLARGRYLAFVDSDDFVAAGCTPGSSRSLSKRRFRFSGSALRGFRWAPQSTTSLSSPAHR